MKFQMLGDANKAGPVRLSDVYDSEVGGASTGIAASQKALYDAYNSLNSRTIKLLGTQVSYLSVNDLGGQDRFAKTTIVFAQTYPTIQFVFIEGVTANLDWVGISVISHTTTSCVVQTYCKYVRGSDVSGNVRLYILGL